MNINWTEIKEKYPNSFKKFKKYFNYKKVGIKENFKYEMPGYELCLSYNSCNYKAIYDIMALPFEMVYGLLEKFFDDNGIIIGISHHPYEKIKYRYGISNDTQIFILKTNIKTRQEAQIESIPEAFEILEKKLKNEIK